jgi:hypothetical protein
MNVNRQISQHQARIKMMQREALIGGVTTALLMALTICAFAFHWHIVLKVLLLLPTLGMLAHAAAPYTRIRDHRRKLRELEARKDSDHT